MKREREREREREHFLRGGATSNDRFPSRIRPRPRPPCDTTHLRAAHFRPPASVLRRVMQNSATGREGRTIEKRAGTGEREGRTVKTESLGDRMREISAQVATPPRPKPSMSFSVNSFK